MYIWLYIHKAYRLFNRRLWTLSTSWTRGAPCVSNALKLSPFFAPSSCSRVPPSSLYRSSSCLLENSWARGTKGVSAVSGRGCFIAEILQGSQMSSAILFRRPQSYFVVGVINHIPSLSLCDPRRPKTEQRIKVTLITPLVIVFMSISSV